MLDDDHVDGSNTGVGLDASHSSAVAFFFPAEDSKKWLCVTNVVKGAGRENAGGSAPGSKRTIQDHEVISNDASYSNKKMKDDILSSEELRG